MWNIFMKDYFSIPKKIGKASIALENFVNEPDDQSDIVEMVCERKVIKNS